MAKKEIKIKGKKVVYHVSGEGLPVVLIHGFGEKSEVWNNQVEYLEEKYKIVVPELPGSGESEMQEDMSMEGMAETVKEVLDAEKISRCIVIGHSMGGYILLAFAEKYFSYLDAFGLFHSTAFADSEEKKVIRRKGIEFINEHGAFTFLENTTPNLFSPLTKEKRPEIIDEQIQSLHDFSPEALISYYEAMIRRPDRTHILRNSTIPVLFIAGKNDNAVPLSDILKQCHLPPLSYIHILESSGHMGMLEETQQANQILKNFLDKTTFN
jgi:pimeloyl-ACP methyl ester carboxylesterase